jgi:hypothetical protein
MENESGMLGKIPRERTERTTKGHKTTLLTPQQNYGKDNYTMLHHSRWSRVFAT